MAQDLIQQPGNLYPEKGKKADVTSVLATKRHWQELVHRYQELVDKELRCGLTYDEAQEIEQLGAEIDADEVHLDPH